VTAAHRLLRRRLVSAPPASPTDPALACA
jgi:hypothetical protein